MSYGYNDANHDHAVTHLGGVQKYWYDANGNQVTRIVGSDTYDLAYDAENRLVEVKKNNITIATFVYDGDGNRVKSTIGSLTTAFVGNHTEWEVGTSSLTRYYYAGSTRVVMRKNNTVYYLLGDHLGSTSVTTDRNGQNPAVQLYAPWGEVRYSSGSLQTRYTYTGQYSNVGDFGLMYYNARYCDPLLSRFSSADSIIPQPGNPQSWDRYSYVYNNPVNATDPTGHAMKLDDEGNTHECPTNTCYIVMVGSTPGLPYYQISPPTYGENIMNTSSGGGSMDAGVNTLPDVTDKNFTVKNTTYKEPAGWVGGFSILIDLMAQIRNWSVEIEPSRINVFAFYKVEAGGISVKSIDVQNPTRSDVTVMGVGFTSTEGGYNVVAGPSIHPIEGNYGIPPVAQPNSTTSISLLPSGYTGNPNNTFSGGSVGMIVRLVHTQTGMQYKWIQGTIR